MPDLSHRSPQSDALAALRLAHHELSLHPESHDNDVRRAREACETAIGRLDADQQSTGTGAGGSLTRRAALTTAAAGALAAALPAAASASTAPAGPGANDRRLVDLGAERDRCRDRANALAHAANEATDTMPEHLQPGPDNRGRILGRPALDTSISAVARACGGRLTPCSSRPTLAELRDFNRHTEACAGHGTAEWHRRRAEGRERIRHWIARQRERDEAKRQRGIPEMDAEMEALLDRVTELEREIVSIPANGPAGLLVKVRVTFNMDSIEDVEDPAGGATEGVGRANILADLQRLAGEA